MIWSLKPLRSLRIIDRFLKSDRETLHSANDKRDDLDMIAVH